MPKTLTVVYPEAFAAELRLGAGAMLRVVTVLGVLAFVAMWFVDPLLALPEELPVARNVRVVVIAVLGAIFAASFSRRWVVRWARPAVIIACLATGGAVIVLTYLTGGGTSDYHEALYLTVFAYALLPMPWSVWDAPVTFVLLLVGYDVLLLAGDRPGSWGVFATHNALIGAGVVIASVLNQIVIRNRVNAFLQRNALTTANRQLQALDDAKSRFFANLSHELRTPLTLTLAPLDALLEGGGREPLTEGQREKLLLAQRNALRLLRLVDDLLSLTKAEAASLRLVLGDIALERMIDAFAADVRGLTARKQISLVVACEAGLPTLCADAHLVERVLLNLVGNAAKFTDEGGTITVAVRRAGDGVELSVRDTGIGIAPEHLPHIFDRFYQADSGSKRRAGGTGIGLALVKELVEAHHGHVGAESVLGAGTVVRCWFPWAPPVEVGEVVDPAPDDADPSAAERTNGLPEWHQAIRRARSYRLQGIDDATERRIAPRPQPKGHAPTVLVVEDNPDMIRFVVALLASEYNVLSAQNGRDGLRVASERRPDLIISDVMMPEMNGFEMLERLRADPLTHGIPFIFLTARGSAEDRVTGRQGGAETYLAKPFRSEELLAAVDALLTQHSTLRGEALSQQDEALVYMATGVVEHLDEAYRAVAGAERELAAARSGGDARAAAALGPLQAGSAALAALVRELGEFAQAGAQAVVTPAEVDGVTRAVLAEQVAAHPTQSVHVTLDAPVPVPMTADELAGVLGALVTRALAVSPPHAAVEVVTERVGAGHVVVRVHDEGPGVLARDAERLFFAYGGGADGARGLGLLLQRRLVQARGGTLALEPGAGPGTTFVMRLPVANAPSEVRP